MRPLQAHCHLGLGTLYAMTGQREQARAELDAARGGAAAMTRPSGLPHPGGGRAGVGCPAGAPKKLTPPDAPPTRPPKGRGRPGQAGGRSLLVGHPPPPPPDAFSDRAAHACDNAG